MGKRNVKEQKKQDKLPVTKDIKKSRACAVKTRSLVKEQL